MSDRHTNYSLFRLLKIALATAALVTCAAAASRAQTAVVYNSIPHPLPPNVASEGPEAYAFSQLGDGLALAGPTGRTLDDVTVVLSSWACTSGNWYTPGSCMTDPDATFSLPITLNIYSVMTGSSLEGDYPLPAVGPLLASVTRTFRLPYRPSSNSVNCDGTAWYDRRTKACYHGLAVPITFDLSPMHVILPAQVIVGIEFNSTHYGPSPLGELTACYTTTEGCFYDSLNISTDSNDGLYQAIGSSLDENGIFVNYTLPDNSCTGSATVGTFGLDAAPGCWTGYHPQIQITAHRKDNEPNFHHGENHGRGDHDADDHRNNRWGRGRYYPPYSK